MTLDQIVDLPKHVRKLDGGDPTLLLDARRLAHRARCIREMAKELQYDADTFRMRLDQEFTDEELKEAGL